MVAGCDQRNAYFGAQTDLPHPDSVWALRDSSELDASRREFDEGDHEALQSFHGPRLAKKRPGCARNPSCGFLGHTEGKRFDLRRCSGCAAFVESFIVAPRYY